MNPKVFRRRLPYYEEQFKHDSKSKRSDMNLSGWINGFYVYRSLAGLNGKPYISEPAQLFVDNDDVEYMSKEEEIQKKTNDAADGFRAFAIVFNNERNKKRKEVQLKDGEYRHTVDRVDSINSEGERGTGQVNGEAEHTE